MDEFEKEIKERLGRRKQVKKNINLPSREEVEQALEQLKREQTQRPSENEEPVEVPKTEEPHKLDFAPRNLQSYLNDLNELIEKKKARIEKYKHYPGVVKVTEEELDGLIIEKARVKNELQKLEKLKK